MQADICSTNLIHIDFKPLKSDLKSEQFRTDFEILYTISKSDRPLKVSYMVHPIFSTIILQNFELAKVPI